MGFWVAAKGVLEGATALRPHWEAPEEPASPTFITPMPAPDKMREELLGTKAVRP